MSQESADATILEGTLVPLLRQGLFWLVLIAAVTAWLFVGITLRRRGVSFA